VTWMSAVSASWRRRRLAACRSIRVPRLLSRIGPRTWSPVAPLAGGSGTRTTLCPCRTRAAPGGRVFSEVGDGGAGGLEDPQAEQGRAWPPARSRTGPVTGGPR
jgi:hypothetical protein